MAVTGSYSKPLDWQILEKVQISMYKGPFYWIIKTNYEKQYWRKKNTNIKGGGLFESETKKVGQDKTP